MNKFTSLLLFIVVTTTWGTTWLAMQMAVSTIPPLFATGLRFMLSAPLLIAISCIFKAPLAFPEGKRKFQFIVSAFYFAIPFSLMIYGEEYVNSGLAAVIFSNMPVAMMLASVLLLKEKTNVKQVLGLAMATLSLAAIIFSEMRVDSGSTWHGILALFLAMSMHAVMYTKCKRRCNNISIITFNTLPCLLSGVMLTLVGWIVEQPELDKFSLESLCSIAYLGMFSGVFGILFYFSLQERVGVFKASMVFLLYPLIAINLESIVHGHSFSIGSLYFMAPLLLGVFIMLMGNRDLASGKLRNNALELDKKGGEAYPSKHLR